MDAEDHLPLTPATFHILLALAGGALHGYGIKRDVEERTGDVVRLGAGTLYEGLQRLEGKGLVEETEPPPEAEPGSSRWRYYGLTALGRAVVEAEVDRLEADVRTARARIESPQERTP